MSITAVGTTDVIMAMTKAMMMTVTIAIIVDAKSGGRVNTGRIMNRVLDEASFSCRSFLREDSAREMQVLLR